MMETTVNTTTQGKMVRNTVMRTKKNQMKRKKRRMRIKRGLRRRRRRRMRMKTLKMKKKVTVISRVVSRLLIHVVI